MKICSGFAFTHIEKERARPDIHAHTDTHTETHRDRLWDKVIGKGYGRRLWENDICNLQLLHIVSVHLLSYFGKSSCTTLRNFKEVLDFAKTEDRVGAERRVVDQLFQRSWFSVMCERL